MINFTKDIQSLTAFRRNSGDLMKQLKKTKRLSFSLLTARRKQSCRMPSLISDCSTLPPEVMRTRGFVKPRKR